MSHSLAPKWHFSQRRAGDSESLQHLGVSSVSAVVGEANQQMMFTDREGKNASTAAEYGGAARGAEMKPSLKFPAERK